MHSQTRFARSAVREADSNIYLSLFAEHGCRSRGCDTARRRINVYAASRWITAIECRNEKGPAYRLVSERSMSMAISMSHSVPGDEFDPCGRGRRSKVVVDRLDFLQGLDADAKGTA